MTKLRAALLLAVLLGLPMTASSVQTTVGAAGMKPNAGTVQVLPTQPNTMTQFSVKLSTRVPTLILAANSNRMGFYIVNASSKVIDNVRAPTLWLSTGATTNVGTAPAIADLVNMKGTPITPCGAQGIGGELVGAVGVGGNCKLEMTGVTVYKGAIYGMSESSGTTGYDPLGTVQGFELTP